MTGGTGFIGRYVVDRLRSAGSEPVVTTSGDQLANGTLSLDLTDRSETSQVISSIRPDIVLHLGGVTGAATDAATCEAVNYQGTVNLLTALADTSVSRVVLMGTAAEYGDQKTPFREDMPLKPASAYAISKARANEFALDLNARTGLPVTVLRVFTAYAYGQPRKMFLSQLLRHALLRSEFSMSDGLQRRDLVYVSDVVDAILAAAEKHEAVGRAINIATGRAIALRDLAAKVWEVCGADAEMLRVGKLVKSSDDAFDTEADTSLAGELLNWRPVTPFIGDAEPGHPLYEMADRMAVDLKAAAPNAVVA